MGNFREYKKELGSADGMAWKMAHSIDNKMSVVYGSPDMTAIAIRIKNQLNENPKRIAFSGVMPEFNHNEMVGCTIIILGKISCLW